MKIEYIKGYDPIHLEDSLLRIYEFNAVEANELMMIFEKLAEKSILEFELGELPFINSIKGINFTLKVDKKDIGIQQISEKSFICNLSPSGWQNAKELTRPFSEDNSTKGYHWLYDLNTDIDFLLSIDGRW